MVTTLLAVIALATASPQTAGFPDVPRDHWAYESVTRLKSLGILKGYPPGQ